jgi:hypothetical protein
MKRFGQVAVAAVALMVTAEVASAQLAGIPFGPVATGTGIIVAADYAKPSNDLGGGTAYGLTGGAGFGRFGFTASYGSRDPGGSTIGKSNSYGGVIGMRLFGGGLNPVSVGVQVGGSQTQNIGTGGSDATFVLPGAWVKVSTLFPIKPYGVAYYSTGNNRPTGLGDEARFVIGANLSLLLGFGFHAAYDWGNTGSTWGVGAHFNFRLPGVPVVPGV